MAEHGVGCAFRVFPRVAHLRPGLKGHVNFSRDGLVFFLLPHFPVGDRVDRYAGWQYRRWSPLRDRSGGLTRFPVRGELEPLSLAAWKIDLRGRVCDLCRFQGALFMGPEIPLIIWFPMSD